MLSKTVPDRRAAVFLTRKRYAFGACVLQLRTMTHNPLMFYCLLLTVSL